jgi:hypothetical protein
LIQLLSENINDPPDANLKVEKPFIESGSGMKASEYILALVLAGNVIGDSPEKVRNNYRYLELSRFHEHHLFFPRNPSTIQN